MVLLEKGLQRRIAPVLEIKLNSNGIVTGAIIPYPDQFHATKIANMLRFLQDREEIKKLPWRGASILTYFCEAPFKPIDSSHYRKLNDQCGWRRL
jgi:hypothetical protein